MSPRPAKDADRGVAVSGGLSGELLHFSERRLWTVNAVEQGVEPDVKPEGLWLSVGLAWPEWCHAESFALDRFTAVTRVVLADDAKILRLDSAAGLDRFTMDYGHQRRYGSYADWNIDWRRVAEQYDGIVIAPYVWERRHNRLTHWYYGWDVASGCIWHPRAVASLNCVELDVATAISALEAEDEAEATP